MLALWPAGSASYASGVFTVKGVHELMLCSLINIESEWKRSRERPDRWVLYETYDMMD